MCIFWTFGCFFSFYNSTVPYIIDFSGIGNDNGNEPLGMEGMGLKKHSCSSLYHISYITSHHSNVYSNLRLNQNCAKMHRFESIFNCLVSKPHIFMLKEPSSTLEVCIIREFLWVLTRGEAILAIRSVDCTLRIVSIASPYVRSCSSSIFAH